MAKVRESILPNIIISISMFICIWLAATKVIFAQEEGKPLKVKVTPGAYFKALPESIVYESTIPIVFSKVLPSTDVFPAPVEDNFTRCNEVLYCELFNNSLTIMDVLQKEFIRLSKSVVWGKEKRNRTALQLREKRGFDFLGDTFHWCCNVATDSMVNDLWTSEKSLQRHVTKMSAMLSGDHQHLVKISDALKKYSDEVGAQFKLIKQKILHSNRIITAQTTLRLEKITNTTFRELWLAIQTLQMIFQIQKLFEIQDIMNQCRNKMIPVTMVPKNILEAELELLKEKLTPYGQELAINRISDFYELKIAECVISQRSVSVKIKIPVKQKDHDWKLYELIATPFAWKNQTCVIIHEKTFVAIAGKEMKLVTGTVLHECMVYSSRLCYLPRYSSDHLVSGQDCARKLFATTSPDQLNGACAMSCQNTNTMVISEITQELFAITNLKGVASIECTNGTKRVLPAITNDIGAIELQLPCACSFLVNEEVLIPAIFPCDKNSVQDLKLHVNIPGAWVKLTGLNINPLQPDNLPVFDNVSEVLNPLWLADAPHVNLTFEKQLRSSDIEWDNHFPIPMDVIRHTPKILIIWNVILTAAVIYSLFRNQIYAGFTLLPGVRAQSYVFLHVSLPFLLTSLAVILTLLGWCLVKWILAVRERKAARAAKKIKEIEMDLKEVQIYKHRTPSAHVSLEELDTLVEVQ